METICKETFGKVSAYRHYEAQKKEIEKEKEGIEKGAGAIYKGTEWRRSALVLIEWLSDHMMA